MQTVKSSSTPNLAKNIRMDGSGNLVIQAIPIKEGGAQWLKCISCKFSSARIKTQDKLAFKYGKIEARIKNAEWSWNVARFLDARY